MPWIFPKTLRATPFHFRTAPIKLGSSPNSLGVSPRKFGINADIQTERPRMCMSNSILILHDNWYKRVTEAYHTTPLAYQGIAFSKLFIHARIQKQ